MNYRPEIDGLRALAVFSVVVNHAHLSASNFNILPGGYLGVDIFFVISGYLITKLIFSELIDRGTLDFGYFFERRIRRILPMLMATIIISLPLAWYTMLPDALAEYSQSVISAILFSSNFFFYLITTEYSADISLLKPMLHTWSLGIEEQFYIFFPVTFYVVFKFFRKYLGLFLILVGFTSLIFSELISQTNSDLNFFHTFSRAWELLIGCGLAYAELNYQREAKSQLDNLFSIIGLCIIILSIVLFSKTSPHPGLITLLPTLGVALVIRYSNGDTIVRRILSNKSLVGIGLISYSIYLLHFPAFAFLRLEIFNPNNIQKTLTILVVIILSILSYLYVEKPFRDRGLISKRILLLIVSGTCILLLCVHTSIVVKNGFPSRVSEILQADYKYKPWLINKDKQNNFCYGTYGKREFCSFEGIEKKKNIFIVGDSILESLTSDLYPRLQQLGFDVVSMNSSACYFSPDSFSSDGWGKARVIPNEPCDAKFQKQRLDKILLTKSSIVILGGMLDHYIEHSKPAAKTGLGFTLNTKNTFNDNYKQSVMRLLQAGHTVIQLYPSPRSIRHVGRIVKQSIRDIENKYKKWPPRHAIENYITRQTSIPYQKFLASSKQAFRLLNQIQHENFYRVYPHKAFCNTIILSKCVFSDGSKLFVVDNHHPSSHGARLINEKIVTLVKKLED